MPDTAKDQAETVQASAIDKDNDMLNKHSALVKAAEARALAENDKREEAVAAVFNDFFTGDPLDPITTLRHQCMKDHDCDANTATRRLLAMLGAQSASPILSAHSAPSNPSAPPRVSRHIGGVVEAGRDVADRFIEGATLALAVRTGLERDPEKIKAARNNEFLAMSVSDLCRYQLQMNGQPIHGNREDLIRRVLAAGPGAGTDHFPAILENIANKAILDRFENAPETWNQWTYPGNLTDYREASRVNKSLFDKLDKMVEHQAFEHGRFADVKQAIQGFLHGKEFSLTLQSLVNDDLSLLNDDMGAWGEAASATIGDGVSAVMFTAGTGGYGQTMTEDGQLLFHEDHNNLLDSGSGTPPSIDSLGVARTAMMNQRDPNDRKVASRPRYILHGTTLTNTIWTLLNSQIQITGEQITQGNRNWAESLGLVSVEEHRMDDFSATAWALAAARRTVEVGFVQGQRTPRVDRMANSSVPGITWQISIPFGIAALDWRTMYLNYGA